MNEKEPIIISHIVDVDREIFSHLNDRDLIKTCNLNNYTQNIVCDSSFWHNRFIKKFRVNPSFNNIQEAYRILSFGHLTEIAEYIILHGTIEMYEKFIPQDSFRDYSYSYQKHLVDLAIEYQKYGILERLMDEYKYSNIPQDTWYMARKYQDPVAAELALKHVFMGDFDRIFYWTSDVVRYGTPRLTKIFFEKIEDSHENPAIYISSFIRETLQGKRYEIAYAAFEYILDYHKRTNGRIPEEAISLFLPVAIEEGDLDIVYETLDFIPERYSLNTSLEAAASIGDIKLFDKLAHFYWESQYTSYNQLVPLRSALKSERLSIMEYAYENTSKDSLSKESLDYLLNVMIYEGNVEAAYFLIDRGVIISDSRQLLEENITKNNEEMVKLILDQGLGYDLSRDKELLRIAANANNFSMAQILLDNGAPPILYKKISREMRKFINSYR